MVSFPDALAALATDMVDDQVRTAAISAATAIPPAKAGPAAESGRLGKLLSVMSDIVGSRLFHDHRATNLLEDFGGGAEARKHAVPQRRRLIEVHDEVG